MTEEAFRDASAIPRSGVVASTTRVDVALVELGIFGSRSKAQEAIQAGLVTVEDRPVIKPSARVKAGLRLEALPAYPWVSRGGVKLCAGLDLFGVDPAGRICLDIGASTGGFTDVLLARGASRIYAVDVGRGQLHPSLASNAKVIEWSETDARRLTADRFPEPPTLLVCDASFIALHLILPVVLAVMAPLAEMVALIKPQFEVGRGGTHKGIVRDELHREEVCCAVRRRVEELGWRVLGLHSSPIAGRDGNVEYLIGCRRP